MLMFVQLKKPVLDNTQKDLDMNFLGLLQLMAQKINPHPAPGRSMIPLLYIFIRCNSWECSVYFFRDPCPTQQALMFKISRIQFDLVDGWICNKASSQANLTIFLSENIRKIYCLPPNYLSVYFIFTVYLLTLIMFYIQRFISIAF